MKKRVIGIYCIKNKVNNRCYIGQSDNIFLRWKQHQIALNNGNGNSKLQKDWDKYGSQNFQFLIIEETAYDQYELNSRESFYANQHNVWEHGYNEAKLLDYSCLNDTEIEERKLEVLKRLAPRKDCTFLFKGVCESLNLTTDELAIIFKNISEDEMEEHGIYLNLNIVYSYKSDYSTIEVFSWEKHLEDLKKIDDLYNSL
jgi:group I intron endonuclease